MVDESAPVGRLGQRLRRARRWFVLTGAGCSTASGIPDYRGRGGEWKRPAPIEHREFVASEEARRRYWARSMAGWPAFSRAQPNEAHRALARLEATGRVVTVATQNVDGLHQRAGSVNVIDLHGRNDTVVCLGCSHRVSRELFHRQLVCDNPRFEAAAPSGDGVVAHSDAPAATLAPDGHAELGEVDVSGFKVRGCPCCGATMKPDVVFFGDAVPRPRVEQGYDALARSDVLLAVGTSLMVYSAFRYCRAAAQDGKPIVIVNRGYTRADALACDKFEGDCARLLPALCRALLGSG